jgi:ABC-type branched-subunit amino acid transport system substrate-binding protein
VPWLFRLGPSDTDQARAFGQRIYSELRLRKVLLVVQTDHDGRVGRAEFEKAARELKGPAPDVWELPPSPHNFESLAEVLRAKAPQAVVVWTDGTGREQLLAVIRKTTPLMPVFLSTKTAQLGTQGLGAGLCITAVMEDQKLGDSFAVVSLSGRVDPMRRDFEQAYRARTGALLGIAAFEAYEAVRLTAEGLRAAGANRILLRDYFANGGRFHGGPSIVPFDPAGNNVEEFTIVTIDAQAARVALP